MYTNESQTAKLIELGFDKPKNERWVLDVANESTPSIQNIVKCQDYSIGELIDMLPEATCRSNNDDILYYLTIYNDAMYWNIAYRDSDVELCHIVADELIDALYDMVVKLKEEGVI
jgi:hypothetical protein